MNHWAVRATVSAAIVLLVLLAPTSVLAQPRLTGPWIEANLGVSTTFEIRGTGDRNNPIRRSFLSPFSGDELYVRYRIQYDAKSIDQPGANGDGEFLVLWLDQVGGSDTTTHGAAPNIGIHVHNGKNRFMVRFSPATQKFSQKELTGDRYFDIVGRLSKAEGQATYNQLALWVDPNPSQKGEPDATTSVKAGLRQIRWLGIGTGRKTETEDRILIRDIRVGASWEEVLGIPSPQPTASKPLPKRTVSFNKDVLPLLEKHCLRCHQGKQPKSLVRLDHLDGMLDHVVPGNAKASEFYKRITATSEQRMPPKGDQALTQAEQSVIRRWIDEGMMWDARRFPPPDVSSTHWAFQPISKPSVPKVKGKQPANPVDAFILKMHEKHGLSLAPAASDRVLQRRLAMTLTGLPSSSKPRTYNEQIKQTLSSRAYAEHWARHWLDVARWAESNGHQHNRPRLFAWRFREYVIDAFQTNKPFDTFVHEQIAGDHIATADAVVATGFLAAARYSGNELDKAIQINDILVDIANTTAQAFLGLTLECAQCHSHKFDPISLSDYYRFQAFFQNGQPANVVLPTGKEDGQTAALVQERWAIFDRAHEREVKRRRRRNTPEPILVTPKTVIAALRGEEKRRFTELEHRISELPTTWSFYSNKLAKQFVMAPHEMRWPLPRLAASSPARTTHVLIRGDTKSLGPAIKPGVPRLFQKDPTKAPQDRSGLATWITSPANPLTARVWVNRIWQWHFGRGLVATSGDFGTQGAKPTHPELLDFLANELINSGWDTQHIQRLILTSDTFRQSSQFHEANHKLDPDNKFLWRWNPRRRSAESIRDSMLQVAGKLEVVSTARPSIAKSQWSRTRVRSIYLSQQRDRLPHFQKVFDAPGGVKSCSHRRTSTVPLQPLYLLNSDFVTQMVKAIAEAAKKGHADPSDAAQLRRVYQAILGRNPDSEEQTRALKLVEATDLTSLARVLLNTNEFLYIP